MLPLTEADLRARHDFARTDALVHAAVDHATAGDSIDLLRFLGRYISWNGGFGSGVATLAGKIGRSRAMFLDADEPVIACADRSVHVASFFFDAARDEFDDSATPHRDTHRTLAQAVLKGIIAFHDLDAVTANGALDVPLWLSSLEARTQTGYGAGSPDELGSIGRAIGFHLGSEILADEEFSLLDSRLRERSPKLVQHLLRHKVRVADHEHPAWYWIGIHSGHGGGVEGDHFAWAVKGAEEALRFTLPAHRDFLHDQILLGFDEFARCHLAFFERVNER